MIFVKTDFRVKLACRDDHEQHPLPFYCSLSTLLALRKIERITQLFFVTDRQSDGQTKRLLELLSEPKKELSYHTDERPHYFPDMPPDLVTSIVPRVM